MTGGLFLVVCGSFFAGLSAGYLLRTWLAPELESIRRAIREEEAAEKETK